MLIETTRHSIEHPTATRVRVTLRLCGALALVSLVALAGCAGRATVGDAPDTGDKKGDRLTDESVCLVIEGNPDVLPEAEDSVWWRDGGNMRCVVADNTLSSSRDAAIAHAAERLLPGTFEMLERRGARLGPLRKNEAIEAFTDAVVRGDAAGFPRVSIQETVVERCDIGDGASHWRARLLAEYPIGVMRGDATHAQWEDQRLLRDLIVRSRSVDSLLEQGRWHDAMLEARRAQRALLKRALELPEQASSWSTAVDDWMADEHRPVRIVRVGQRHLPIAVHAGERHTVRYRLEFDSAWTPRNAPAIGVPVVFDGDGLFRVLPGASETDESGEIAVDVIGGTVPGEGVLTVRAEIVEPDRPAGEGDGTHSVVAELADTVTILSVRDATVCFEVDAEDEGDGARIRDALSRSLDGMGSRLVDCTPDADLVVSATVSVSTRDVNGWTYADLTVGLTVFDQRVAVETGRSSLEFRVDGETAAHNMKDLSLREVGRLIAVYLEARLAER